jgi:hypothetical protein
MKKITSKMIILLAIVVSAVSCRKDHWIKGEGSNVTNTRLVSGFTGVSLSIAANVEVIRDSVFRIELHGQQNILNVITTSVSGNTLDIDLKRHTSIRKHNPITVRVYMPYLNTLDISGSGDINCNSQFACENLNINISGSGDISFQGQINNSVSANVSGSGGININSSSSCVNAKYTISGSGNINTEWLKADYVDARISGSGDQRIHAVKQLNAEISGSGDIAYRGTPAISVHISGSGKLRQIQ